MTTPTITDLRKTLELARHSKSDADKLVVKLAADVEKARTLLAAEPSGGALGALRIFEDKLELAEYRAQNSGSDIPLAEMELDAACRARIAEFSSLLEEFKCRALRAADVILGPLASGTPGLVADALSALPAIVAMTNWTLGVGTLERGCEASFARVVEFEPVLAASQQMVADIEARVELPRKTKSKDA